MNIRSLSGRGLFARQQLQLQIGWQALHAFGERLDWLIQPLLVATLSRLLIFVAGTVGDVFLATAEGHWVADPNSVFLSMWAKWDSQWYVQIARDGYWFQPLRQSNVAFFPLYPMLMRLLAPLFGGNLVLTGFVISNVALVAALIFLYALAELVLAERGAARRTLYYVAFFPTAFFLNAVYTESLFLLFSVATAYFARRRIWFAAAALGMLAAATRNIGCLIWGLVMWEWLAAQGWRITQIHRRETWRNLWRGLRHHWTDLFVIAAIPLGLVLYMAFLHLNFARPFAFVEAQASWGRENIGPVAVLANELGYLFKFQRDTGGLLHILNLAVILMILGLVPALWRKLGEGYALYVLILLLLPISSAVMSVVRYALMLFPIFMLLGWWGRHPTVDRTILTTFTILLGVLTTVFVNWFFIA